MTLQPSKAAILEGALAIFAMAAGLRLGIMGSATADSKRAPGVATLPEGVSTPVLVELFTSEGCSSCPPADALLSRLGRTQPVPGANIIILEEHVDYWDRLGWKDPFSSAAATERQNQYDQSLAGGQAYTPQMVVDGSAKFVGSSDSDALRAIHNSILSAKPAIQLSWQTGDTLTIHIEPITSAGKGDGQQIFLAIAENMLHSDVKRGENAGRALEHNGVVRQLLPLAKIDSLHDGLSSTFSVHLTPEWNRSNLRAVVFVQDRRDLHVLAAAAVPVPNE
jgi:hypothetical protein